MISLALFGLLATLITGGRPSVTFAKQEVFQPKDTYLSATHEAGSVPFTNRELSEAEACGAPIEALEDGLVIEVEDGGWNGGRGSFVKTEGMKSVTYIHLQDIFVSQGMMIEKGDIIGTAGRSGLASQNPCVKETE